MASNPIKAIHALRRLVPHLLEDDTYRDFLEGLTGKRSSKDLTPREAWAVRLELQRLAGQTPAPKPASAPAPDPKAPLVGRLLREAYAAGWDTPLESGPFDGSEAARRARCRARVVTWLTEHQPTLRPPKRLEDWPLEVLQACLEHLKGVVGATKRWGRR